MDKCSLNLPGPEAGPKDRRASNTTHWTHSIYITTPCRFVLDDLFNRSFDRLARSPIYLNRVECQGGVSRIGWRCQRAGWKGIASDAQGRGRQLLCSP